MVDEDVTEDGKLGIGGGDFAEGGAEGRAEALQRGGGVELGDFELYLSRDEFAFEVCGGRLVAVMLWRGRGRTVLLLAGES